MTVLDEFVLLFRSNAKTAQQDVKDLDKQISDLAAKGNKITGQELKSLQDLSKQRKQLTDDLKNQNNELDKSAEGFNKLAGFIGQAAAGYLTFQGVKAGLFKAADFNSRLQVQSQFLGQNVRDIAAYGAAVEQAGGSVEGFQSTLANLTAQAAQTGQQLAPIKELYARFHDFLAPLPLNEALRIGQGQLGLDEGSILLLRKQNYQEELERAYTLTEKTAEETEVARAFEQQLDATGQTFLRLESTLGVKVLPKLNDFLGILERIANIITGNSQSTKISDLSSASEVQPEGYNGFWNLWGLASNITYAISRPDLVVSSGERDRLVEQMRKRNAQRNSANPPAGGAEKTAYDYWLSQGYTSTQAAVLVGNQIGEGGAYGAVGDSGTAFGIAQWHSPERRADILANTGIDVKTAGISDQLKAQQWEMQNRYGITPSTLPNDIGAGTSYLVRNYEFSRDQDKDSLLRAQYALGIASQFPLNSSGNSIASNAGGDRSLSVKVDEVNVHTQATDAHGIASAIGSALQEQIRFARHDLDDGSSR